MTHIANQLHFVRTLIDARETYPEIERQLIEQFSISPEAALELLESARTELRDDASKSIEDHRRDAYAFYASVIRDATNSARDRLLAQQRIDKLLGLEAPLKVSATDKSGNDVDSTVLTQAEVRVRVTECLVKSLSHAKIPT